MKISILLPYKENFSFIYPGAVSIYVKETTSASKYKKSIHIFGNTSLKKILLRNYSNVIYKKNLFQSSSNVYVKNFIKIQKKVNSDIVEIHNRPAYIDEIFKNLKSKIVLYFHNDPLNMNGSRTSEERINLINKTDKIIFNSEWSKKQFLYKLDNFYTHSKKLETIYQSTNKSNTKLSKKKKIITFVGKLNSAKGYDIFGKAIIKILNKYKDWNANVIGDEQREKLIFKHDRLNILGFQKHSTVLKNYNKTSIAVVCSRWNEPFGRTSLEAASRGCAVIISNRGGLPETISDGITLDKLSVNEVFNSIKKLIENKTLLKSLQKKSLTNFYLSHKFVTKKIDRYREELINIKHSIITSKKLKILHITNFNERHDGRLFYNTGKRLDNGFTRLNHSVLSLSDRDVVSYYRSINDLDGSKALNKKLIKIVSNYVPDIIILGHADLIKNETLLFIKQIFPNIKIVQWFLDRMDSEWARNKSRFTSKIDCLDASFCTTSPDILGFPKNKNIYYMPNPADSSFENLEVYNSNNVKNELFFALSHGVHRGILKKGKFDKRELLINKLIRLAPNIKYDLYGMNNIQPIWGNSFKKAIENSKMALNLSQGRSIKYYTSDRIVQLIGNGLLTFIDENTKLNKFFKNNVDVIFYKSINDLAKKLIKFSKNDKLRKKIARNGKIKYLKYFNSTNVANYMISKTYGLNKNKFYWEK